MELYRREREPEDHRSHHPARAHGLQAHGPGGAGVGAVEVRGALQLLELGGALLGGLAAEEPPVARR